MEYKKIDNAIKEQIDKNKIDQLLKCPLRQTGFKRLT